MIVAAGAPDVERRAGGPRERLQRVLDELERQVASALAAEREIDHGIRPAADIDDGCCDRLVHRNGRIAEPLEQAWQHLAGHPRPREVNLHRFFWRELTLVGARLYDRTDFEKAVTLVADGTVPAQQLISKVVPLAQAPDAFEALEGGGDVMKILVDCTDNSQGADQ